MPHSTPLVPLSSDTEAGLRVAAARLADRIVADPSGSLAACRDAYLGAGLGRHRLVVRDLAEPAALVAALRAAASGEPHDAVRVAAAPPVPPKLAHVYSGEGVQWPGMAVGLLRYPEFAAALRECDEIVAALTSWSVTEEIAAPSGRSRLSDTSVAQPAIVAVEIALTALLRHWGLGPGLVIGHSLGEITAAAAAGGLTTSDALAVAVHQGRLLQRSRGVGGMLALGRGAADAEVLIAGHPGLAVAAVNGPMSTVVSGDRAALAALSGELLAADVFHRDLGIDYAFHSAHMDPFTEELTGALAALRPGPTALPMVSTVTGQVIEGTDLDAEHWGRLSRRPVRFLDAVRTAFLAGTNVFVEVSPHPTLRAAMTQSLEPLGAAGVLAGLRRNEEETSGLGSLAAELYLAGSPVRWDRMWVEPAETAGRATAAGPARHRATRPGADLPARVASVVADVVGRPGAPLDPDTGLFELGIDSMSAVALARRLRDELGADVPVTVAFNHPTVRALTTFVGSLLGTGDAPAAPPASRPARPASRDDEIAIVGIGCQVPGAANPAEFWALLRDGVDATAPIPTDRWDPALHRGTRDGAPGIYARRGGFLPSVDTFDAAFFGISPVEARGMDPQQRLLLEVTWQAIENAGISPDRLRGTRCGVYVGIGIDDYKGLQVADPAQVDSYTGTGNLFCVAAGRLSYVLGLHGPSLAIDTGCSSSLVTLHLAAQALRAGECDAALAGGVHLMLAPDITLFLSSAGALSQDGRCRTFDAGADGYSRAEGCGMVVLKRLADARADGDTVLAVIRGSSVNHDGASSGLTVPNGAAQEAVLREALAGTGLDPAELDYVEAHGTGTPLGDPIELHAIDAVYAEGRERDRPLVVASAKTNVGHLEAAAGVVGVIKSVLSLRHRWIPPHLHLTRPSPHIDWDRLAVEVPTSGRPWPETPGRPRTAGVSSFGIGGTNAHLILAEAAPVEAAPAGAGFVLLPISARTEPALRELARRYATLLDAAPALANVAHTAATGREHMRHRLAVAGGDHAVLAARLRTWLAGASPAGTHAGVRGGEPVIAFVFPGQGSQYAGMGRRLYDTQPAFRAALTECAAELDRHLDGTLLDVVFGEDPALLDQTGWTQPAIFAVQYALTRLWRSWGVRPAVVLGHSIGEFAAACAAGALDLPGAARLVATRARLMQALPAGGSMAAVLAGEDTVTAALAAHPGLSVAAVNSPAETVVSGPDAAVRALSEELAGAGITVRSLKVSHAFHSALVDPVLADLAAVAATVPHGVPDAGLVSTVTGGPLRELDGRYWRDNAREPVRLADGLRALREWGPDVVVEIGPHPVLGKLAADDGIPWLASLRRGTDDAETVLTALAGVYAAGATIDWPEAAPGRRAEVPTYPFQRRRYWRDTRRTAAREIGHPLLGAPLRSPAVRGVVFDRVLGPELPPLYADHGLFDTVVVAAAGHLASVLAALGRQPGAAAALLRDVGFPEPLLLGGGRRATVQVILGERGADGRPFQVVSSGDGDRWRTHASGVAGPAGPAPGATLVAPSAVPEPPTALHEPMRAAGYHLGDSYCWLDGLSRSGGVVHAGLRRPPGVASPEGAPHPGLLDSCLRLAVAAAPEVLDGDAGLPAPVQVDELYYAGVDLDAVIDGGGAYCRLELRRAECTDRLLVADLWLRDATGRTLFAATGLRLRRVSRAALLGVPDVVPAHEVVWRRDESPAGDGAGAAGDWLLLGEPDETALRLRDLLTERGGRCVVARPGDPAATELPEAGSARGVVFLTPVREHPAATLEELLAAQQSGVLAALGALRQATDPARPQPRIVLATRGAHRVEPGDRVRVEDAPLWGLGRVLQAEHPESACVLLDLPATPAPTDAPALLDTLLGPATEQQRAVRGDRAYVPRLAAVDGVPPSGPLVRPDGCYVITGGTGALGRQVAHWLFAVGARRFCLLGRRDPEQAARRDIEELRTLGATVLVHRADVTDPAAVRAALDLVRAEHGPLRGVVHAAGALADGVLRRLDAAGVRTALDPKLAGAWALHEATAGDELDFFVLFSSVAALLGTAGQAAYAAGNAFLDSFAQYRRDLGLPAVSIAWGPWQGDGMAGRLAGRDRARLAEAGLRGLRQADALRLLGEHLTEPARSVVADADWGALAAALPAPARPGLFAEVLAAGPHRTIVRPVTDETEFHPRPDGDEGYRAPGTERERLLASVWEELFRIRPIGVEDNFFALGGDSILSLRVAAAARRAGLPLSDADVLTNPTVRGLAEAVGEPAGPAPRPPGQADTADLADAGLDGADLESLFAQLGAGPAPHIENGRKGTSTQ